MDVSVQLVSVLADGKLLVVINRDVYLLSTGRLVLGVVELGHVGMSESLFGGKPLVRVEM